MLPWLACRSYICIMSSIFIYLYTTKKNIFYIHSYTISMYCFSTCGFLGEKSEKERETHIFLHWVLHIFSFVITKVLKSIELWVKRENKRVFWLLITKQNGNHENHKHKWLENNNNNIWIVMNEKKVFNFH